MALDLYLLFYYKTINLITVFYYIYFEVKIKFAPVELHISVFIYI